MPVTSDAPRVLFYAPRSRAFTALWLLEEMNLEYQLESFDLNSGRHKQEDFLKLNPMGKVPVLVERGRAVSELGAIALYLTEQHPMAAMAPPPDNERRPDFLRWLFFASAIMEPSLGEKFFKWEVPARSVAWGSFQQSTDVLTGAIQPGPWLLGVRFTAADVLVASGARFGVLFGAYDKEGPIAEYVARSTQRPAFERASAIERAQAKKLGLDG
ncbi:MAG: glutathione S-transferase [Myxococcota bacterium]